MIKTLWTGFLKQLGLAYWVTITLEGRQKNAYSFGPFSSAGAALSAQRHCCQSLLEQTTESISIKSIRISMEP